MAKYSSLMQVRSKGDREQLTKSLLQQGYDKLAEIEKLVEIADYCIADIDKTAWSLKTALDGLSLVYQRENVLGAGKLIQ